MIEIFQQFLWHYHFYQYPNTIQTILFYFVDVKYREDRKHQVDRSLVVVFPDQPFDFSENFTVTYI
jgi:hypothetical protein